MTSEVIHPKFHHFNLKTTRLEEMIDYYSVLVGAEVIHQDAVGAWLSNDEANHRIALLAFPNFTDDPEKETHTGLHHSAFEYAGFDELNASYLRLKKAGIEPEFCIDHGMTFSYYYADPDGNNIELQVDCFGDWEQVDRVDEDLGGVQDQPDRPVRRSGSRRRRPRGGDAVRRDPRQGLRGRIRARAAAGRRSGDVMKLCRFEIDGRLRPGVVEGEDVVDGERGERHPLENVRLLAPVRPRKFLAIGLNYADHVAESGMEPPEFPIFFNKQSTCVVGPADEVHMPRVSKLARLRGRARDRHRRALPPRPATSAPPR